MSTLYTTNVTAVGGRALSLPVGQSRASHRNQCLNFKSGERLLNIQFWVIVAARLPDRCRPVTDVCAISSVRILWPGDGVIIYHLISRIYDDPTDFYSVAEDR